MNSIGKYTKLYGSKIKVTKFGGKGDIGVFHLKAGGAAADDMRGYFPDIVQDSFPQRKNPGLKNISKPTFPKQILHEMLVGCELEFLANEFDGGREGEV